MPSGGNDGTAPATVNTPSGKFFTINAFNNSLCSSITDDFNGNGRGGELACVSFPNVPPRKYSGTSFFAEATNTDPSTTVYEFEITHSGGTVDRASVYNLANGDRDWQFNELPFTVTSTGTVEVCLIQSTNLGFGADIHLDQIALYATCDGSGNPGLCPPPLRVMTV